MEPIYLDLHIHTSEDANRINETYDVAELIKNIKSFNGGSKFLISFTDHNTINKNAYLKAKSLNVNLILGAELHIKFHDDVDAFHCHIFFDNEISEANIDDINKVLDELYPNKLPQKTDRSIPDIQKLINSFDKYDFLLLPHAGQQHGQFNYSLHKGECVDNAINRSIYYNQFDGFTARENKGLEQTREYFKKLGIGDFVSLITCSDNYQPSKYPEPKAKDASSFEPTWMFAEATFDGIRLSLSESSRLRYQKEKPEYLCEHISNILLRNEKINIDTILTEGLNVVIGGSSSGKTLFVDSIYRSLSNDFSGSRYLERFGVDKIEVTNVSGMKPYYISQNFIAENISDNEEKSIDKIEILRGIFPGDNKINTQITEALNGLHTLINDLLGCVKEIENSQQELLALPHPGNLIIDENTKRNSLVSLQPSQSDCLSSDYSVEQYEKDIQVLTRINTFVNKNPYVDSIEKEVEQIKRKLEQARNASLLFDHVKNIINDKKQIIDKQLLDIQGHNQQRIEKRSTLFTSVSNYIANYSKFEELKSRLFKINYSFSTDEIESMGHRLSIVNNFKFNSNVFLDTLKSFLNGTFNTINDVKPECLFSSKFKLRPKVQSYQDLTTKIFTSLSEMNTKSYKIISKSGEEFNTLSPGWKTAIILDLILGYDKDNAPIIIDQPEDNLAVKYINNDLVETIKKVKNRRQIILVSHNATIPMMGDAQNVVVCENKGKKINISSAALEGDINGIKILDYIADQTDGGKSSIKKRIKKYNLKKFN